MRKPSRTERKLAQALAEIEALRKGWPEMQASINTLVNENAELRRALESASHAAPLLTRAEEIVARSTSVILTPAPSGV